MDALSVVVAAVEAVNGSASIARANLSALLGCGFALSASMDFAAASRTTHNATASR
jgi:hypothetical protein